MTIGVGLTLLLAAAKLFGYANYSWWIVLAPFAVQFAAIVAFFTLCAALQFIARS